MTNVGTGTHLQLLAHGGGRAGVHGPREGAPRQAGCDAPGVQGWPTSTWGHSSPTHTEELGRGGSQAHERRDRHMEAEPGRQK